MSLPNPKALKTLRSKLSYLKIGWQFLIGFYCCENLDMLNLISFIKLFIITADIEIVVL